MANTAVMEKEQQAMQGMEDITTFEQLMQHIAQLPEEQQQKVAYFAQGVMAAATPRKASNE